MDYLGAFLLILGYWLFQLALAAIFGGFIIWVLWDNVMMSMFGLRDITFFEAAALSLIGSAVTAHSSASSKKD